MIPKVEACLARRRSRRAGRPTCSTAGSPTSVLLELFTDAGVGTMITNPPESLTTTPESIP